MRCYLKQRNENSIWYIWQYDERTGQCSRISTRTKDRSAADAKLAEHILKLPQRQISNATLVHILLRYWHHHGKSVFATNPIRRAMGLIATNEPTTLLYDWTIQRQKEFAAKIHGKDGTRRRYMGVIRRAVQWSFDNGEIPSMPAILKVSAEDAEGVRPFEVDELRALFGAAIHEHERRFLLLCLAAAPRPGASLDLTWDRIDAKTGVADFIVPGRRKTKKRRARAPLPPTALAYLEAHRSIGPVIQWNGKQMAGHKMTFAKISKRAGVTGTAYGIRKAVSIWLRMEGVPEWDAKGLLGHTIGAVTEKYAHYRPEYMRAAAASVERLLREICPQWLAGYLPAAGTGEVSRETQVPVAVGENGGSYRTRTYDQFLKREEVIELFQRPIASNDY